MTDRRGIVHELLEAVGAATVAVIAYYLLERRFGWDPVAAAERALRRSDQAAGDGGS